MMESRSVSIHSRKTPISQFAHTTHPFQGSRTQETIAHTKSAGSKIERVHSPWMLRVRGWVLVVGKNWQTSGKRWKPKTETSVLLSRKQAPDRTSKQGSNEEFQSPPSTVKDPLQSQHVQRRTIEEPMRRLARHQVEANPNRSDLYHCFCDGSQPEFG
jgi:hypothetical protein